MTINIVLVEDNPVDRFLISTGLASPDIHIKQFEDMFSISKYIQTGTIEEGTFFLIDHKLEINGQNGFSGDILAAYIVCLMDDGKIPPVRIIGITAHITSEIQQRFELAGAVTIWEKPITREHQQYLRQIVRTPVQIPSLTVSHTLAKEIFQVAIIPQQLPNRSYTKDEVFLIVGYSCTHIRLSDPQKEQASELLAEIGPKTAFHTFIREAKRLLSKDQILVLDALLAKRMSLQEIWTLASCNGRKQWLKYRDKLIQDMTSSLNR